LFLISLDLDLFLDGGDLDLEDQDALEDQCISDFNEEIPPLNGEGQQRSGQAQKKTVAGKKVNPDAPKKQETQKSSVSLAKNRDSAKPT